MPPAKNNSTFVPPHHGLLDPRLLGREFKTNIQPPQSAALKEYFAQQRIEEEEIRRQIAEYEAQVRYHELRAQLARDEASAERSSE